MSAQTYATLGPKLLAQGFEPIPVVGKGQLPDGKSGLFKDWQTMALHPDQVRYWASNGKGHLNVGLRTATLAPIDVDIYDSEVATRVVTSLLARFGDAPQRIGQAPKALLVYLAQEPGTKITSPIWISPNGKENRVEVLGIGQQFVAFGTHPGTKKPYTWVGESLEDLEAWQLPSVDRAEVATWMQDELPALIPADWVKKGSVSGGAGGDTDNPFDAIKPRHDDVDLEALRWMLEQLPAEYCDDRNLWRNAIFAVHHQFAGTEEEDEALEVLDTWSSQSSLYVNGEVPAIWKHVKDQRGGGLVTIGTIKSWLGDTWKNYRRTAVTVEQTEAAEGFRERIASADESLLQGALAAEIRTTVMSDVAREVLVKLVQRRLGTLLGAAPGVGVVRRMLAEQRAVAAPEDVPDIDDGLSMAPDWAREWLWVREGGFLHRKKRIKVAKGDFDTEMQKHVADLTVPDAEGVRTYEPSTRMFRHWNCKVVDKTAFHPAFGEVFEVGGIEYFNMYRPDLRIKPAASWTPTGQAMAQAIERHLSLLIPDRRCRRLFRAWLAHQYMHPGVKVRWAPLLKGAHGDGKSLFGELLEIVLGEGNVRLMSGDTLQSSPFSGWSEGQCVTVFEEVKFHGHNRYDVVNKLKPYIANNRVEKHSKGKDPGSIWNVTNYLLLTNHEDAIPLEIGDRRYFVLFSPFGSLAELDAALQSDYLMTATEHFEDLFSLVRNNVDQLALWLTETEFPDDWDPNMSAPMTDAKISMAQESRSDLQMMISEVLDDQDDVGVAERALSFKHLRAALLKRGMADKVGDKTIDHALKREGWSPSGEKAQEAERIDWPREAGKRTRTRIWIKRPDVWNRGQAVADLDATLTRDFDE
jgi:uncharacterized protein YbdZ (MbtH family)